VAELVASQRTWALLSDALTSIVSSLKTTWFRVLTVPGTCETIHDVAVDF
jgi:hypothetical protein